MLFALIGPNGEPRLFLTKEQANREAMATAAGKYLEINCTATEREVDRPEKPKPRDLAGELAAAQAELAALKAAAAPKPPTS